MLRTITTLALASLVLALIGAGVIYSGVINVGADEPHAPMVHALLQTARERSISVRTQDIEVPDLNDADLIRSGAGNYASMCVGCHLAPGMEGTEMSQNLYPAPPDLTSAGNVPDPATAFWIIKHGIKSTGMPAWGKSMADEYIWAMVAFVQQLPSLDATQYQTLVDASDGHQHGGGETDGHASKGESGGHDAIEPAAESDVHHHADGSKHVH